MADTVILDNEGNETILTEDQLNLLLSVEIDPDAELDEELFPELSPTRIMHDGDGTERRGDLPRTFVL